MISYQDAINLIQSTAPQPAVEEVALDKAVGRTLAETVESDRDYPPFNRVAMDGYAVRSADFNGENAAELKLSGEVYAGQNPDSSLAPQSCYKIMTGAPLPAGADAVVSVEESERVNGSTVVLKPSKKVVSGMNVARKGEDLRGSQKVFDPGTYINPAVVSLLASVGKSRVKVYKNPGVAVLSTGYELKDPEEDINPWEIRDANRYALQAMLNHEGIPAVYSEKLSADPKALENGLKQALQQDVVILSGGISMGETDLVPEILYKEGFERCFHKVMIKPGKPVWFGVHPGGRVVFALPGNPVSCQVTFRIFISPFLRLSTGAQAPGPIYLPLNRGRWKKSSFDEFFPVKVSRMADGKSMLIPLSNQGSEDITALPGSHGLARHPFEQQELPAWSSVEFFRW